MPKRIQRKCTKGWKMPPNTVYVGRPTKWGNPFNVHAAGHLRAASLFELAAHGDGNIARRFREATAKVRAMLSCVNELRGCDVACWCAPDEPCHADVLL